MCHHAWVHFFFNITVKFSSTNDFIDDKTKISIWVCTFCGPTFSIVTSDPASTTLHGRLLSQWTGQRSESVGKVTSLTEWGRGNGVEWPFCVSSYSQSNSTGWVRGLVWIWKKTLLEFRVREKGDFLWATVVQSLFFTAPSHCLLCTSHMHHIHCRTSMWLGWKDFERSSLSLLPLPLFLPAPPCRGRARTSHIPDKYAPDCFYPQLRGPTLSWI